jgi:hypothetical protein
VLRVELTEGRRRTSTWPLLLIELVGSLLPYALLGVFFLVLYRALVPGTGGGSFAGFFDQLLGLFRAPLVSSIFLLIVLGVAFSIMVNPRRQAGDFLTLVVRATFDILAKLFVLLFRTAFRVARSLSDSLRRGVMSRHMLDRSQRGIQVRTVDVEESATGRTFTFQIRGELTPYGGGIAEGQRVAVEEERVFGRFVVRRVFNLTTQTELRWTTRAV